MRLSPPGREVSYVAVLGRGAGHLAGLGAVLGGLAGTVAWPAVGTFFGVAEGAAVGAVTGLFGGAGLAWVSRRTRSSWALRATSGAAGAVGGLPLCLWPVGVPRAVAALLTVAAVVVAGMLGPLIVAGRRPPAGGVRPLVWGAAAGAAAGGGAGLVIGVRVYPPTAAVAAVEGAAFGVASGVALACLAVGVAMLARPGAPR